MDNKNLRDISGVVIFPILTIMFFIFGWFLGMQGLIITGCVTLCVSLVMQTIIMNS